MEAGSCQEGGDVEGHVALGGIQHEQLGPDQSQQSTEAPVTVSFHWSGKLPSNGLSRQKTEAVRRRTLVDYETQI